MLVDVASVYHSEALRAAQGLDQGGGPSGKSAAAAVRRPEAAASVTARPPPRKPRAHGANAGRHDTANGWSAACPFAAQAGASPVGGGGRVGTPERSEFSVEPTLLMSLL